MADPVVVTSALLRDWALPEPGPQEAKDARGTVLVVGGALSTPGAVLLAGTAALRVGAGRLQVATAAPCSAALGVALPEAAVHPLPTGPHGAVLPEAADRLLELAAGADAVCIGPGLTGVEPTRDLLARLLAGLAEALSGSARLVLDALALTCGALTPEALGPLAGRVVLTPNRAEAARMLGEGGAAQTERDAERGQRIAAGWAAVASLHGATWTPDGRCWQDGSGDVGLATSGSGDVLAGVITGLCARGASTEQAAVWGAHLHAEAGDRLAARIGRMGLLARELPAELPGLLHHLSG